MGKKPFQNILEKGENAADSIFSFSYIVFNQIKDKIIILSTLIL